MRMMRAFRTAIKALRRNIMRAVLTTLGIVIGIAAVITMMEIGQGSADAISRTIESMGANTLIVMPGTASSGGVSFGSGSELTLTPSDGEAIEKYCRDVAAVAPIVRARVQIVYGNKNWVPMYVYGSTPEYLVVRDWKTMAEGECFTDQDVRNASKVCVLGQTLVKQLLEGQDPIGKEIRIHNVTFKVIGVLSSKGANMMGFDQDDLVLAPWTTIKYRVAGTTLTNANQSASTASASVNSLSDLYPSTGTELYPLPSATQQADTPLPVRFTNVDQLLVSARSSQDIPAAINEMTSLLRERHRIEPGEPSDFSIRDMTEMMLTLTSTTTLMTKLLLIVALISLIVGGVGIMNIMLVSVTERTREIGLRMAVGARGKDILSQFLVEAIVLCLVGGAMGIALGRGTSLLIKNLLHWPVQASMEAVIASVAVSMAVGIVFGFYPAWKAAKLDPIEALRYE